MKIELTAYDLAQRFVGVTEAQGPSSNPAVLAMLQLDGTWPKDDSVPWCSAFLNYICWLLRLPRSKSLAARSWLEVGLPIGLDEAISGFDVVVLQRGSGKQPGPMVINAPGHVGFFGRHDKQAGLVYLLGGNQGDGVTVAPFSDKRILGVRRLLG